MRVLNRFGLKQAGQGFVEYGLVIAVIALVVAFGADRLSHAEHSYFQVMAPRLAPTPDLSGITPLPTLATTSTPTATSTPAVATATPTGATTVIVTAASTPSSTSTPTLTSTATATATSTATVPPATATPTATPTVTGVGTRDVSILINCSPNPVAVFATTTCTVSVTDTNSGPKSAPSGTVAWTNNGSPGSFSGPSTCTLAAASGNSSTCSVTYQPNAVGTGTHTPKASYSGDADHVAKSGIGSVGVSKVTPTLTVQSTTATSGDASVLLTATVSAPTTPTGAISFTITQGSTIYGTATSGPLDGNGQVSVSYALPSNLNSGSYTITAAYSGTSDIASVSKTATLSVLKQTTSISVPAVGGAYGSKVDLNATLMAGSTPLSGKTVTFTLNGTGAGSAVTNASGVAILAGITLPSSIAVGTYPTGVQASFSSDPIYANVSGSASLTVGMASTTTTVSNTSVPYGAPSVSLSAAVAITPSSTIAVNQGSVAFTVKSGSTVVGTSTSGAVSSGSAAVTYSLPTNLAPGQYSIDAVYSGGTNFNMSVASTQYLTIVAASTTTKPKAATTTYGDASVTLTATVTANTPSTALVTTGTAIFTVRNASNAIVGSAQASTTFDNGTVAVIYSLPAGTPAGTYTITVSYSEGTYFLDSSGSSTLTINKRATTLSAAAAAASYGGFVSLSATLTDGSTALSSGSVTFTLPDGSTAGTAITDATGTATVTATLPTTIAAGTYSTGILARFVGDTNYQSVSASGTLVVNQAVTRLTAYPASGRKNTFVTLKADVSATPVVNAGQVIFSFANGATTYTCTSNVSNGTASASCATPNSAGTYAVAVTYVDSAGNYETSSGSATLTLTNN